jgi:hypothetical protein
MNYGSTVPLFDAMAASATTGVVLFSAIMSFGALALLAALLLYAVTTQVRR